MARPRSKTVQVPLTLMVVDKAEHSDRLVIPCPGCDRRMQLHQPEEDSPTRLLGTCDPCRLWAAIEMTTSGGATLVAMPSPGLLADQVRCSI